MKTPTSKSKSTGQPLNAPIIHTPQLPRHAEQFRQRAGEIYRVRGGTEGMTLMEWLKAEQKLRHASKNPKPE